MPAGLLLIAHAPLASALKAVALHTYDTCTERLSVLDVDGGMTPEDVEREARAVMARAGHEEWLILCDAMGATPCNGARGLLDPEGRVRLVTGVNVPMLWRMLCYDKPALSALVDLAIEGGRVGITSADIPDPKPPEGPESP